MKQTLFKTLLAFSLFTAAACYSTQAAPGDLYDGGLSDAKIYKFDTAGTQTVFVSGSMTTFQPDWLAFDSQGNLFASNPANSTISKIPPNGSTITDFATGINPGDIAFDAAGNLFAIDGLSGSIFKYTPSGAKTTFVGPGFNDLVAMAFASDGNLFVTRRGAGTAGSGSIVKFTPAGAISTFAGGLFLPKDLAFDSSGNLYEADSGSGSVFKFAPNGTQTTFKAGLNAPQSLAFARDGNLFVGECPTCDIVKITPGGTSSVFASPPAVGGLAFEPPAAYDFNQDGKPDYVLYNAVTHQTAVWYLNNNVFVGDDSGPTLQANWNVVGVADFDGDGRPDYLLFNSTSHQTAIWYLSGTSLVSTAFGPSLPNGWDLVAVGDFNADGKPDYVLYNAGTRQTAIWYLNNNAFVSDDLGPTLPANWRVVGVADFNGDNKPDYLLFNSSTGQTEIWYLSGPTFVTGAFGPSIVSGYTLIGAADFDRDGKPDYVLYSPATRQTAIWYLNNNAFVSDDFGPTLPANWNVTNWNVVGAPTAQPPPETATMFFNSQSLSMDVFSGDLANVGTVYNYVTTFDATSMFPLHQSLGDGSFLYSQELRPRVGAPGTYEADYVTYDAFNEIIDYGSFVVSLPTLDADGNGLPDVVQPDDGGNASVTGISSSDANDTVSTITGSLFRDAGSSSGSYSISLSSLGLPPVAYTGTFNLLTGNGTLTYSRQPNTATLFVTETIGSFSRTLSGTTSFQLISANQIFFPQFSVTSSDGYTYTVLPFTMNRSGAKFVGRFQLVDGQPETYWRDYVNWVLEIDDFNDVNGNGIPDLSDPALGAITPSTTWVLADSTGRTGLWSLLGSFYLNGAFGPTLPSGWTLISAADVNGDDQPDLILFNSRSRQTAVWYLNGATFIGGALGPTLPLGWSLVGTADVNGDGHPDYVLFNAALHRTAFWFMNNASLLAGAFGPTLPPNWSVADASDFNGDGNSDLVLSNAATRQTAIWYLNRTMLISGAFGPALPSGWTLVATADFNGNGKPDYLLYSAGTRQTAIWYLNNNMFVSGALGPTVPAGWRLVGQ